MGETPPIVYLNGQFMPLPDAKVSVLDRGFVFADGVYEVIPAYGGKPFRLTEHLHRLDHCCQQIGLKPPLSHAEWKTTLHEIVSRNGGGDLSIYLQITRGEAPRDHLFPTPCRPTVVAIATPVKPLPETLLVTGATAISFPDWRWLRCDIKAIALLPNVLARQQAFEQGAQEAIFVRDGIVTEGAASNVFVVKHGVLKTPPTGPNLLPGITRDLVIELCREIGLPCHEQDFDVAELRHADEVWLTSSMREIVPVTRLDGAPIGNGKPGPAWRSALQRFRQFKDSFRQQAQDLQPKLT